MFDFICDYIEGEPTTSNETSDVMWVSKDKVLEYVTSPVSIFKFTIVHMLQNRNLRFYHLGMYNII